MAYEAIEGLRLSPHQRRVWKLQEKEDDQPYRAQCNAVISGPLEIARLRKQLQKVVNRHEILRTQYQRLEGMRFPLQVIRQSAQASFEEYDLRGMKESEKKEWIEKETLRMRTQKFEYDRENSLRAQVAKLASDKHVLMLAVHALSGDGTTLRNIIREVSENYWNADDDEMP